MPSIAEAPISPQSGSKKRRRDGDAPAFEGMKIASAFLRRPVYNNENLYPGFDDDHSLSEEIYRRQLATKAMRHDAKRQRIPLPDIHILASSSHSHEHSDSRTQGTSMMDIDADTDVGVVDSRSEPVHVRERKPDLDLNPCHVCRRKPTGKQELESYTYCQACEKRTCDVCMRKCAGLGVREELKRKGPVVHTSTNGVLAEDMLVLSPIAERGGGEGPIERLGSVDRPERHAHRDLVCSLCCRENGPDGEVWCLGCLAAVKGV